MIKARALVACVPHPLYKENSGLSIIPLTISSSHKLAQTLIYYHNLPITGETINTGPGTKDRTEDPEP